MNSLNLSKAAKAVYKGARKKFVLPCLLFLFQILCFLRANTGRKSGISLLLKGPRIIISLTTVPSRLPMLYMTIESLLRQTKKPNAIFLWLSKSLREQDIPAWLRRQARRGLTIRFCEDIGPHTKYYYAFKENPEDLIATCDDDRIYAPDWLEGLYETHRRDPKSIICYRAHQMLLDASGTFKKYHEWNFFSPGITDPSHFLFATGVGGILYPPGLLHEEVLNKELFLRLCPKADDIWLKAMAALNRIPHRKVKALFNDDSLPVVPGSQKTRLWDHNFGGGNDEQIKAVFNHFHLYDFFLEQSKCCRSFELKMNPRK